MINVLNDKKLILLSLLRKNNRQKLTNLSRQTHVPVSTIFDSLKNDFNRHIVKHTCLLDFTKIGFTVKAMVLIKFKPEEKASGISYLSKNLFVNSLSRINNGYDVSSEIICKDINALEEFLDDLELNCKIRKKDVFYLMNDIKREAFFSTPETLDCIKHEIQ